MSKMDTQIKQLDVMPLVKYYMKQLDLYNLLKKHIPNDTNCEIEPAQVLCIMIMNIIVASKPLYKVDEWLVDYLDGKSEPTENAAKYNDDRLGRGLEYTFNSDRDTITTDLVINAIKIHELETKRFHNDSTSISFYGAYNQQAYDAVQLKYGYNKDNRPDCKQIVFGLNITEDGHVPISYQLFDGNQADVSTHIPNWDNLRDLIATEDFLYVADSKLCSIDNLHHIHVNGGEFVTLIPKNRNEVKEFYERLRQGEMIEWELAYTKAHSRKKAEIVTYKTYDEEKTREGYRIIWVHSSSKEKQDRKTRERRIKKVEDNLKALLAKLNKYTLKTREQIEKAIKKACKGAGIFVKVEILENKTIERVKIGAGRPSKNSKYKDKEFITYDLRWHRDDKSIKQASKTDGLFPLTTNATLSATEILQVYKKQPFIEKRFYTKKSILEVAPVFLKNNRRIEAMMFLYFIALMIVSLIERNIRNQMIIEEIENLQILPAKMKTKAPTWNNILYFFRSVHLALIKKGDKIIQSTVKGVTALHNQVLKLLKVPYSVYSKLRDNWWLFEFQQ